MKKCYLLCLQITFKKGHRKWPFSESGYISRYAVASTIMAVGFHLLVFSASHNFSAYHNLTFSKLLSFLRALKQCNQSETLYQSSNNYPDDNIVTQSGNFCFSFEGDSYCFRKPNLFIFISAREFSFLHCAFNLLKIFTKF